LEALEDRTVPSTIPVTNLLDSGPGSLRAAVAAAAVAAERSRIAEWMAANPEPTGVQLKECLPWYDPARFGQAVRLWRLGRYADESDQLLNPLLATAGDEAKQWALALRRVMAELVERVRTDNRPGKAGPDRGAVPAFSQLLQAGRRLGGLLDVRGLDAAAAEDLGAWRDNWTRFVEEFPALLKLASVWGLAGWLARADLPTRVVSRLDSLLEWLRGGRWLSTFPAKDQTRSQAFARQLADLAPKFRDGRRAALGLMRLWLESTQRPGLPERRLRDLDAAWWLSRDLGQAGLTDAADGLVVAAGPGAWPEVAARAFARLDGLHDSPLVLGPRGFALQDCLRRLSRVRCADRGES
jgi:hypothetical protein